MNFHPPFSESPSFFFFLISQILIGSNTLLQKFTPHFKILDPRLPSPSIPISFPEAAILLVIDGDRDLWPCLWLWPLARSNTRSPRGLLVTLRMPRVKLVLVSIYCVYRAIQNRNVVGPGQGPGVQFPAHDKRDPWGRGCINPRSIDATNSDRALNIDNQEIKQAERMKLLGVYIDENLTFAGHIGDLCT